MSLISSDKQFRQSLDLIVRVPMISGPFLFCRIMHANIDHLIRLFRGVMLVRDALTVFGQSPNRAAPEIRDMKRAFSEAFGVKITRRVTASNTSDSLRGLYLRLDSDVTILLSAGMDPFWERFVSVKEMCHLILSDPEYRTNSPSDLIEAMVLQPAEGEAPNDLTSDMWCRYAAIELLYPYEARMADLDQVSQGRQSIFSLSQYYEIPEHVIEMAISDTYMEISREAWRKTRI